MTPRRCFGRLGGAATVLHLLLAAVLLPGAARARESSRLACCCCRSCCRRRAGWGRSIEPARRPQRRRHRRHRRPGHHRRRGPPLHPTVSAGRRCCVDPAGRRWRRPEAGRLATSHPLPRRHPALAALARPPAGAPIANETFFCENSWGKCWSYGSTLKSWQDARTDCQGQGGDLVVYASAAQQLLVEGYFTSGYSQPVTGLQRPNLYGGQQGAGAEYWVRPGSCATPAGLPAQGAAWAWRWLARAACARAG
jgi:hypothetical protein